MQSYYLCLLVLLNCCTRSEERGCSNLTMKPWGTANDSSRTSELTCEALQTLSKSLSKSELSLSPSGFTILPMIQSDKSKSLSTVSIIGDMVWKVLEEDIAGCYFVVVTTAAADNHLLNHVIKNSFKATRTMTYVVAQSKDQSDQYVKLKKAIYGGPNTVCRVYLIDVTLDGDEGLLQFLDSLQIWLWSEARVVIIGRQNEAREVLHHPAFRNVLYPIFIGLKPDLLSHVVTDEMVNNLRLQADEPLTKENNFVSSSSLWVYGRSIYGDNGQPKVQFLFRWPIGSEILQIQPLIPDESNNLRGHFLRFVSMPSFPYNDYTLDTEEPGTTVTLQDSLDKRVIETLSFHLNFTYEVRAPIDGIWGIKTPSGNWTGMLGAIQSNTADLTTLIAPSPDRFTMINQARVYTDDGFTVVSLKPQLIPQYLVITQPFTGDVWMYLILCIMIWGLTLWSLQKARAYFFDKSSESLSWAIFYSWAVVLEDPPSRPPTDITSQTLIGWWLLATLVMATGYKSSLVAFLAIQSRTTPVDTFQDLVEKNDWNWGVEMFLYTGAPKRFFQTSTDPVVKLIYQNLEPTTIEEALKKILNGKYAFLIWRNLITTIIKSYHTDNFGESPYYIGKGGSSILGDYGWGFRKGAPYKNQINQMMDRMVEAGIIDYWKADIMSLRIKENRRKVAASSNKTLKTTLPSDSGLIVLRTSHLLGVFLFLLLGFCTASLAFLGEVLVSRWS